MQIKKITSIAAMRRPSIEIEGRRPLHTVAIILLLFINRRVSKVPAFTLYATG
jgi:hypothetical protein